MVNDPAEGFSWTNRRKWVARLLWWHMAALSYLITPWADPAITAIAFLPLCGSLVGVITGYMGFAASENWAIAKRTDWTKGV